ncbi:MAG: glycerophosphodiester phosphodiesterase family protein [Ruminococcus sp.]|nr:glycerophosphodiester phosphodiesterase family protein [Ruminococcus sp.]
MKKSNRLFFAFASMLIFMSMLAFSAYAQFGEKREILDDGYKVMVMSHRGSDSYFPPNCVEAAVATNQNEGADMVSISVGKTKDGVLVLSEDKPLYNFCDTDKGDISDYIYDEIKDLKLYGNDGKASDFTISTFEQVLKESAGEFILVVDNAWGVRDEIYELCSEYDDIENVILRTDASSKEIAAWVQAKKSAPMNVIGIYDGNIIFNAVSHLTRLSKAEQPAVQYQSKNYFNVMYGSVMSKKLSQSIARAAAPMYDKDLCGQRTDDINGWDEMIAKGYTIIETNNVWGLKAYLAQCEEALENLAWFVREGESIKLNQYSQVSANNFSTALENANNALQKGAASLSEIQECTSVLIQAKNSLTFSKGSDLQKGNLNITAGKIIAVVVFGSLILAGEIYVHKMHKPKKKHTASNG